MRFESLVLKSGEERGEVGVSAPNLIVDDDEEHRKLTENKKTEVDPTQGISDSAILLSSSTPHLLSQKELLGFCSPPLSLLSRLF